jgi:hypothetical protein
VVQLNLGVYGHAYRDVVGVFIAFSCAASVSRTAATAARARIGPSADAAEIVCRYMVTPHASCPTAKAAG